MRHALCAGAAALVLPAGGAFAQDLLFAPGEGPFSWDSFDAFAAAHDFAGERLTVTGAGAGVDSVRKQNVFAYFTEATGADVAYTGSESFETEIVIARRRDRPRTSPCFPSPASPRTWPGVVR